MIINNNLSKKKKKDQMWWQYLHVIVTETFVSQKDKFHNIDKRCILGEVHEF